MKLSISFLYDLYNLLTEDRQDFNEYAELIKSKADFLLQNIHILDLPYLHRNSVEKVKNVLAAYFLEQGHIAIFIPKYEYILIKNEFLSQELPIKVLNLGIQGCEVFNSTFKDYNIKASSTNDSPFNSKAREIMKLYEFLEFMNEFFCISYKKIYNFLSLMINVLEENSTAEDVLKFFDYEFEIKINSTDKVSNYENFDNFINCEEVIFNRFLTKYNSEFLNIKYEDLQIFLSNCKKNHNLTKLLVSDTTPFTIIEKVQVINYIADKYRKDTKYISKICNQVFKFYQQIYKGEQKEHELNSKNFQVILERLDWGKDWPDGWYLYDYNPLNIL